MARKAKLEPVETDNGWRLNIPAKLSSEGKRERYFFKTKKEALAKAATLKKEREEFGNQARAISPALAEQAHKAAKMLEPFGVSLLEAVADYAQREGKKRASKPIEEALAAFRKDRETVARKGKVISAKQAKNYRLRAEKFISDFGGRLMADISCDEIETHLNKTTSGPGGFDEQLKYTRTIWRWCARPKQGWCDAEILADIEPQGDGQGEIGVLTAKQAEALLAAAIVHQPDTVPAFAVALFTGMRQAEIARLIPQDFTEDGITVPAMSAKTKRRRYIHMSEPLASWLKAYPIEETVCPPDWPRKYRYVRRMAGFRVWSDLAKPQQPPKKLPVWPNNALRHTAATVSVNLGKPLEALVFEHGHTGGLEMLKRHYLGAMPKREALEIWALTPAKVKAKAKKQAKSSRKESAA